MKAKKYLSQAFDIKNLIEAKKLRIQDLRDKQHFIGSTLSDVKVQNNLLQDPFGDVTVALLDLIDECQKDIVRLIEIQKKIEGTINSVDGNDLQLILFERYVNQKRWEDIASDNNYGWDTVHRKHRLALDRVQAILDKL